MALRFVTLAGLVAFAVSLEAAPVPKGEKTAAEKVVGRWELLKSAGRAPAQKHIITFSKDGVMTMDVGTGDEAQKYEGKYKVVDNAIDYELDFGGNKKAEKLDIKTLEGDDMKTTDPDGIEEIFKRVKEKDKEK
jgi:uncharacterized protein (TIGR03066 family)